jgi:UDP-N-acetyl-D-glucosamine/UDP-N-acetyl-D-galactosamine dehydrogenase
MKNINICMIGLGYVGLPVAVEFSKKYNTIGFDTNNTRINELKVGIDKNKEFSKSTLRSINLKYTSSAEDLKEYNFYIIAVPTSIDSNLNPDLSDLHYASEIVGRNLLLNDIVVYESTVYPGVTEEICIPILEKYSNLKNRSEFKVGYSPERINPGDVNHKFTDIIKVVSAQDKLTIKLIAEVYNTILKNNVFEASSIKVAEASKLIENTQRDLNIALINELSLIFNKLDINTMEVLDAACSKWNFHSYQPGLVGGHCIGVDPYYLTHIAQHVGYYPQVILAGRRINNEMAQHLCNITIKELIHANKDLKNCVVTILGLTFKENCNDLRNTKVVDIVNELNKFSITTQISDPIVNVKEARVLFKKDVIKFSKLKKSDAVIIAVAHIEYKSLNYQDIMRITNNNPVIIDVKSILKKKLYKKKNIIYKQL